MEFGRNSQTPLFQLAVEALYNKLCKLPYDSLLVVQLAVGLLRTCGLVDRVVQHSRSKSKQVEFGHHSLNRYISHRRSNSVLA